MGQEIVYCDGCRCRLSGTDFERGGALRVRHETFCADCAPKTRTPAAAFRPPSSSSGHVRVRPSPPPAARRPSIALWIGLALAALAFVVAVAVVSSPRRAAPRAEQPAP